MELEKTIAEVKKWEIHKLSLSEKNIIDFVLIRDGDKMVCNVSIGDDTDKNSTLIASAPEMLEHIKYISKNLKNIFENFEDILPYNQTFVDMVNKSDRLIKKATNEPI